MLVVLLEHPPRLIPGLYIYMSTTAPNPSEMAHKLHDQSPLLTGQTPSIALYQDKPVVSVVGSSLSCFAVVAVVVVLLCGKSLPFCHQDAVL